MSAHRLLGERKLSRRALLKGLSLTAAGATLAACGQATPQVIEKVVTKEVEVEKVVTKEVEKVVKETVVVQETVVVEKEVTKADYQAATISWWNAYSTPICQEMFPIIIKDFENLYPGIKVDFQITGGPPGGGDLMEVLLSRIAAGNPPDTAAIWTTPAQFAARGSLTAIDDFMVNAKWAKADAFYQAPLKSCQWRGKTFGLPSSAGCSAIYINVGKFKEKGISAKREDFPKTWDDLKALSKEFVIWENDELKHAGFAPWATAWAYPAWSGLNGGEIFSDKDEKYHLDSPQNAEWLNYMVKWLDEQYKGDIEKMNTFGNWSGTYPQTAFNMGLCAMAEEGSWSTTDAEIPFEFEVARYAVGPSGKTSVTAWWPNWWILPKGSPHPREGFLFIEYLSTKGWETWYTAIMDTPAWKNFSPAILTTKLVAKVGLERAKDFHKFFGDYLENGVAMWNSPIEDFANTTINGAVDEVLHKTKQPKDALADAQNICQAKLEETLKA